MGQGTGTISELFRSQYACVCACVCVPVCVYARVYMCACVCVWLQEKAEAENSSGTGSARHAVCPPLPPWKAGAAEGLHSACPQPIKTQGSRWEGVG